VKGSPGEIRLLRKVLEELVVRFADKKKHKSLGEQST